MFQDEAGKSRAVKTTLDLGPLLSFAEFVS